MFTPTKQEEKNGDNRQLDKSSFWGNLNFGKTKLKVDLRLEQTRTDGATLWHIDVTC